MPTPGFVHTSKKDVHTIEIVWGEQSVRICVGAEEEIIAPYLLFLRGVYGEDNVIFRPNTGAVERTEEEKTLAEQIWKQAHGAMIQAIKDAQKKLEADQKEEKTKEMVIDQKVADSNWQDMERLWAQKEVRMHQQQREEEERKRRFVMETRTGPCPQCGGNHWSRDLNSMRDECQWCGYSSV